MYYEVTLVLLFSYTLYTLQGRYKVKLKIMY